MIGTNNAPSQATVSSDQPSDDVEISSRVCGRLASCGHPELAQLSIRIEHRTVTLEGTVRSYYLKQIAQVLVMSMDEVVGVRNAVEVVK